MSYTSGMMNKRVKVAKRAAVSAGLHRGMSWRFAPTVGITETQRAECDVALEVREHDQFIHDVKQELSSLGIL
jgi:hypothetical protein